MSKAFKAVWLGDGDPQSQVVRMGDLTFVKGQSVTVSAGHEFADRIEGNPTFAVDGDKAEPLPVNEPSEEDQAAAGEAGTEKAALKQAIRDAGGDVPKGNASVETLRAKLVDLTK